MVNQNKPQHIEEKPIKILDRLRILLGGNGTNLVPLLMLISTLVLMARDTKSEDGLLILDGIVNPLGLIAGGTLTLLLKKRTESPKLSSDSDADNKQDSSTARSKLRRDRSRAKSL
jgi:hypothetical protein